MENKLLIYISILCISTVATIAQVEPDSAHSIIDSTHIPIKPLVVQEIKVESNLTWHTMITKVPDDIVNFSTSAFNSNKIPLFAALATGTGILLAVDQQGWQANRRLFNHSKSFHNLSNFGVALGNEKYHFVMAGVFTAFGIISGNSKALKTGSNIVEAVIASGVSVQLLKRVFGRESPAVATEPAGEWKWFPSLKEYQKHQPKYYAYPSGHITTLTATVTVIANNYPEEKWIKPVGYSLVALCGIGLVSRGMHWYSDLPIGFFLGYTFGNLISPQQEIISSTKTPVAKVHFSPLLSINNLGLQVSFSF